MLDASVTDTVVYGIYIHEPVPAEEFFNDVRALGRRILGYASSNYLKRYLTTDFIDLVCGSAAPTQAAPLADTRPVAWASAPGGAAATTAALAVLGAADITEAADRLHDLIAGSRDRGLSVSGSNIGWGREVSTTLTGVQLRALAPFLGPSDQLRYRVSSPLPKKPHRSCETSALPRRNVPALLWHAMSVRFAHPALGHTQLRSALSVAVNIVGTRFTLDEAAHQLGSATTGPATSRILQTLHNSPLWPEMSAVLIRLATYLDENPHPIDYAARRALPYADLLSDTEWSQICGRTGTPPGRGVKARVVRCWLYQRLSGSPAMHCPGACPTAEFRSKLANFPSSLTPELLAQLDMAARRFLDCHGRSGEPTTWCPPVLVDDLNAPAGVLGGIDTTEVRRLIRDELLSIDQAAHRLGAAPEAIRHLLETSPLALCFNPAQRRARGLVLVDTRAALTEAEFIDRYQHHHQSLSDIARVFGVSRQTISRLGHAYGITLRPPCRPQRETHQT